MYCRVFWNQVRSRSRSPRSLIFALFLFLLCPKLTLLFNFDLRSPIVIHDSFDKPDSHFGASVVLVAPSTGTGWIVIGAPKAESPLANYSTVREPGVVWKCSLGIRENAWNCSLLEVDPIGELDVKLGQVPKEVIHRDRKDFGRFGSAMSVGSGNSSRFVVCASNWANQKYRDHHLMNGLCYWLPTADLLQHDSNNTAAVPSLDFSHRLLPLINSSRQAYTLVTANGQLTERQRRFDWAFGQAGFSIDISPKNEVLLGAPGVLEWAGSVVQYKDYDPIALSLPWRRFNQKDSTLAQVRIPRAQTNINRKVINYFDYFGYSVVSGNFLKLSTAQTQYAAGAPRGASLHGKVLIFSFKDEPRDLGAPPDESMNFLTDPITGDGSGFFGSYFGSVLAVADVNGDGLDDLLVGAPQYETTVTVFSENSNGSTAAENNDGPLTSGDEGCVFVYFSLGDYFGRNPQEICGDSRPGARFGSAISRLGDTNFDGFQDVAVGAPYESENRGAVYIYLGSAKRLIFSQKLIPEAIDLNLRGFGYALSAGVDIDENGYGDLAVGAYDSNHVVIFTTRAVVDISSNISASVTALGSSTGQFTITSCCNYKGHRVPDDLQIWVKITLDPEIRKSRIVEFLPNSGFSAQNFSKNQITFTGSFTPRGNCHTFKVTTLGDLDSITVPVIVRQEVWLDDDDATPEPIKLELRKTDAGQPTLDIVSPAHSWSPKLPIVSLISKNANPTTISIPILAICEEDGDPTCLANLSISATFKTSDGAPLQDMSYVIGSSKSVILQIELTNHRERANLPLTLEIAWTNPLILRSSQSDCKRAEAENDVQKLYICSLLAPLGKNKKELIEMELDTTGLYAGKGVDLLTFGLRANTSSAVEKTAAVTAHLRLGYKAQLLLHGQSAEISYYENITAETVNFTQLYEMSVTGLSPIHTVQFHVALPSGVLVGGRRLSLLRIREPIITYDGTEMSCHAPNGTFYKEVDLQPDLDLPLATGRAKRSPTNQRRTKRSVTNRKATLVEQQPIIINCQTPGVDCLWVECEIFGFAPSYRALVEFRLRMITETARLLFSENDRDILVIESLGRLSRVVGIQEERFAVSRTLIPAEIRGELKAWILIVAIGGGVIIFTIITMILMRCGFFRRTKLEELTKLKAGQSPVFTFDDGMEPADSLEYYDGALSRTDFEYQTRDSGFGNSFMPPYKDEFYDELQTT